MNDYWIFTTVFMISIIVICHWSLSLGVVNIDVFGVGNPVELEILAVDFITPISWRIICDDCKIICVVLSEDRVEVVLNPKHCVVSETGGDNAHWQFCVDSL